MKSLKHLPVLLFFSSLFFISCDEESYGPVGYEDSKTTTTLQIEITDTRTNFPLDSVLVRIIDSDSAYTDPGGLAKIIGLWAGTYQIVCEKSGYETITFIQVLELAYTEVPILPENSISITMSKKGVAISGAVYYEVISTTQGFKAADSALVECILPDDLNFKTRYDSIYTDSNGVFTFDSLPEHINNNYTLSIKPYKKNSKLYTLAVNIPIPNNGGISAGDTVKIAPINLYERVDNFQILAHNLDVLGESDSGRIDFSEAVNLSILTPDSIYLTNSTHMRIPAHFIWSPVDSSSLLIKPFDGSWDKRQNYRLFITDIRSAVGKVLLKGTPGSGWDTTNSYYGFNLLVKGSILSISSLKYSIDGDTLQKADYNEDTITLFWPALSNTIEYRIYKKGSQDLQWTEVAESPVEDTAIDVKTAGWFNDGDSTLFFVIGVNADTTSPIDSAVKLTVKDEIKPRVIGDLRVDSVAGFNNNGSPYAKTIIVDTVSFSEPMDMDSTKKPDIIPYITAATIDSIPRENCTWKWISETKGYLQVVVDALNNCSVDSIAVNFKICTDKAGNLFDSTETTGLGIQSYKTKP